MPRERGVRVRLIIDDLYTSGMDPLLLGLDAHPNVEVRLFNPFPAGAAELPDALRRELRATSTACTGACTTSCSSPTA